MNETVRRFLMTFVGVLISGFCVGLFNYSAFGMDPFQVLAHGIFLHTPLGFGTLYMLINLWIQGFTGNRLGGLVYWQPLLSSIVVWPIYHALLGYFYIQRKIL